MSLLLIVRHGQASFLADNYDKLSPTGELQARLLGEYWLAQNLEIAQVYHGPGQRHIRTGELVAQAFRQAGRPWPEPIVDPNLDEFPAEAVLRAFLGPLSARYPHIGELVQQLQASADFDTKRRIFDRVLREVSERWLAGEVSEESVISWAAFCDRIEGAVRRIIDAAPRSSTIAVFTSAGPMAATARAALGLSYETTLNLTWAPRNASFSEFLFTPGRFSMSTFNSTPHLTNPELVTYR